MRILSITLCGLLSILCACNANPMPPQILPEDIPDLSMDPGVDMSLDLSMIDSGTPIGAKCKRADDCPDLQMCDHLLGKCVECRVSDDCAANQMCQNSSCRPATACSSDVTCKPLSMVCDTKAGRCVECNGAGDCKGNDPMRLPKGTACLGHSCIPTQSCMSSLECGGSLVCAPGLPPTWPTGFMGKGCAECATSADCPSGAACKGELCFKVCLKSGRKCGTFEDATCGACPSMTDSCSDLGLACISQAASFFDSNPEGLALTTDYAFLGFRNMTSIIYKYERKTGMKKIMALPSGYINSLVTNSTHLFWAVGPRIVRVPFAGGLPEDVHTLPMGDSCYSIAVDDKNVYCELQQSSPSWSGILQIPLAGGTPIKLTDPARSIGVRAMVPYKDKLYYAADNFPMSVIAYTPIGGGTSQVLARVQPDSELRVDDTHVYFSAGAGIFRIPVGGGMTETLASAGGYWLSDLNNGMLYCQNSKGELLRINVKTSKLEPLLTEKDGALPYLRADGKTLFGFSGALLKQINLL